MTDNDIDLYADDIDQDFAQVISLPLLKNHRMFDSEFIHP